MRKTIVAVTLSIASITLGFALAGSVGSPAIAETSDAEGSAGSSGAFTQVQEESPDPDAESERSGRGDHNCPDRDGDGEPDPPEDSPTSLEQA